MGIRQAGDDLNPQLVQRDDQKAGEKDFVEVAQPGKIVRQFAKCAKPDIRQVDAREQHAAQGQQPTVFSDLAATPAWAQVGLATGSAMVAPVRTDAGLWAILEVWSDFRAAFTPQDVKLLGKVAAALAKKTPAA